MVSEKITEASGLAASRKHPGYLYTHNDGNYRYATSAVYVISATTAALVATLTTTGVAPHDLEDIAVGPCRPGNVAHTCIYIGTYYCQKVVSVYAVHRHLRPSGKKPSIYDVIWEKSGLRRDKKKRL